MPKLDIPVKTYANMPFTFRENVSEGTLYGKPVELTRAINGDIHWLEWDGRVYEFKLTDIITAIAVEVKSNE